MTARRPIAMVAGIGEGFGLALADVFAAAGHDVIGLARSAAVSGRAAALVAAHGARYRHLRCDLADPEQVAALAGPVAGEVTTLVHCAHHLLIRPFAGTSAADFEQVWRAGCFSAFNLAQPVLAAMSARGSGSVIFTGATASRRAGAQFAAFASAKFALRGLAQSLAREYGPKGVHVAHVVVDGLIDEVQSTARFGPATSARIDAAALARLYLDLARQPPAAWTHELDLRPAGETF